jgi:hypothetical protein
VRIDWKALASALGVEGALLVAAVFGGPHGALGGVPWVLNLPGALVVFGFDDPRFFLARVALAVAIQVALWYFVFRYVRRRRRHLGAPAA